jgi:molecular chaperone DnaK (HSP70)
MVWDEARDEGVPVAIAGYSRPVRAPAEADLPLVPSLIHYAPDGRRWVGEQVVRHHAYDSPHTFRWMKRYIARRSPVRVRVGEREVSHQEAGRDFLRAVLASAAAEVHLGHEEVAFTVPVEAFEHYENWLADVAEAAGMPRFRLLDEPSAAALGYGAPIQPGDVYLIFDFGGGTLDVALVLIEPEADPRAGRRCRVLGKAGADLGGATIDGILFQEVLRQNGRSDDEEAVRAVSRALLVQCEEAKERLSADERAEVRVALPSGGEALSAVLHEKRFEELLDEHRVYTGIDQTVRRALNAARERGYSDEQVKAVLMVGGSSLIPSVQRQVQRIFGRERVSLRRPLDAIARGAAAFVAGVDFYDHIQHDYAVRHVDPRRGDYAYRPIVPRGTPYPTTAPVARLTVKASHDGQTQLGLAIFEMGEAPAGREEQPVELVFDPSGAARVRQVTPEDRERRQYFWVNEQNPTFLTADPPARRGEPRFEVEFGIDGNKRLLVTVRDVKTSRVTHRDFPVVKLT